MRPFRREVDLETCDNALTIRLLFADNSAACDATHRGVHAFSRFRACRRRDSMASANQT